MLLLGLPSEILTSVLEHYSEAALLDEVFRTRLVCSKSPKCHYRLSLLIVLGSFAAVLNHQLLAKTPIKKYLAFMELAGLQLHQAKSPFQFVVDHAETYLLNRIRSQDGYLDIFPAFINKLVDVLMRFNLPDDNVIELREQYILDLVRAVVATTPRDRLRQGLAIWIKKYLVAAYPRIVDPEIPLSDALAGAAAVGNFKAVAHFLNHTTDFLEHHFDYHVNHLSNAIVAAASTGKSVMIEYLLAKVKVGLEMDNESCKHYAPAHGSSKATAECKCENKFYVIIEAIKAALRGCHLRAANKLIEFLRTRFVRLAQRDRPDFLGLAMESHNLKCIKHFLKQDQRPNHMLKMDPEVLAACHEILRNGNIEIIRFLLEQGIVSAAEASMGTDVWLPRFDPLDIAIQHNHREVVKILLEFGAIPDVYHVLQVLNTGITSFPHASMFPLLRSLIDNHHLSASQQGDTNDIKPLWMQELNISRSGFKEQDPGCLELLHGRWRWVDCDHKTEWIDASMIVKCDHIAQRLFVARRVSQIDAYKSIVLVTREIVRSRQYKGGIGLPPLPSLLAVLGKIATDQIALGDSNIEWRKEAWEALRWFDGLSLLACRPAVGYSTLTLSKVQEAQRQQMIQIMLMATHIRGR